MTSRKVQYLVVLCDEFLNIIFHILLNSYVQESGQLKISRSGTFALSNSVATASHCSTVQHREEQNAPDEHRHVQRQLPEHAEADLENAVEARVPQVQKIGDVAPAAGRRGLEL